MKMRFLRNVKMMALAVGLLSAASVQAAEVGEVITSFTDNENMKLGVPYTLVGGSREYLRSELLTFQVNAPADGKYAVEYLVRTTGNNVQLGALANSDEVTFDVPADGAFAHTIYTTNTALTDDPADAEATEIAAPVYMYSPVDLKAGKNYVHVYMYIYWRNDNVAPQKVQFESIKVLGEGSGAYADLAARASQKAYQVKFFGAMQDETTATMVSNYEALVKAIQTDFTKADTLAITSDISAANYKESEVRHGKGVILNEDSTRLELLLYHSEWDKNGKYIDNPQNGVYEMENGEDEWPTQVEFTQTYSFSYKFTVAKGGNWFPQFLASSANTAHIDITILGEDSTTVVMPKYSLSTGNGAWQNYELMDDRLLCKFKGEEGKTYFMNLYYDQYTNVKGILMRYVEQKSQNSAALDSLLKEAEQLLGRYEDPASRATIEDQTLYPMLEDLYNQGFELVDSGDEATITEIYGKLQDAIIAFQHAKLLNSFPNSEANPFDVTRFAETNNCAYKATDDIMQLDNFRGGGHVIYKVFNTQDAEYEVNFEYANAASGCTMEFIVTVKDEETGIEFEVARGSNIDPYEGTGGWSTWEPKQLKIGGIPTGHVYLKITGSGTTYVGNPRLFSFTPIAGTEGAGEKALAAAKEAYYAKYSAENLQTLINYANEEKAKYPEADYDQTQVLAVDSLIGVANAAIEANDVLARADAYKALEQAIEDLAKSVKLYTTEELTALIAKAEEEMTKYPAADYDQLQVSAVVAAIETANAAIAADDRLACSNAYAALESAIAKLPNSKPHTWITAPTSEENPFDLAAGQFDKWQMEGGGNIGYAYEAGSVVYHLNITAAGTYDLHLAVGLPADGAQMRAIFASLDGAELYNQVVDVPNTGAWSNPGESNVNFIGIELPEGKVLLTIFGEKAGGNGFVGNTHTIALTPNDPNGIETITANSVREGIYTLQGVRVDGAAKKGLYIKNGKKVVLK